MLKHKWVVFQPISYYVGHPNETWFACLWWMAALDLCCSLPTSVAPTIRMPDKRNNNADISSESSCFALVPSPWQVSWKKSSDAILWRWNVTNKRNNLTSNIQPLINQWNICVRYRSRDRVNDLRDTCRNLSHGFWTTVIILFLLQQGKLSIHPVDMIEYNWRWRR